MATLTTKTALVTGAFRGIGRATAPALATAGARVVVHYGSGADEAKSVVDQISAAGGRADAVAADLAAVEGAHALAAQVHNLVGERLDIIVANAGIMNPATIEETTVQDFDNLFAVDARPISLCSSCYRSSAAAAASCSSPRSPPIRRSA
jgi:3-oxoacyl-[acyl-carrier protein] reductase